MPATTVTIFEHPLSPYAQKVKLALQFKGVSYAIEHPMATGDATEFMAASPRGEVPVLQHNELTLYDSAVIGAYIEEQWPEPNLLPAAPYERAQLRLLEQAMDTHFEGNTWGLGEVLIFGRADGVKAEKMRAFAEQQIRGWYAWLETRLGTSTWFNGTHYGWGDICVVPFVNGAGRFDISPVEGTRLANWLIRVNDLDAVRAVAAAAETAELDPAMMRQAIKAGFKREYRDHRLEWMVRADGLDVVTAGLAVDNIRFNDHFID